MRLLIDQLNGKLDMCIARKALCNTSHAPCLTLGMHNESCHCITSK